MKLTVEYHAGNPNICRIPELKIRAVPECEGGGWYLPREQAEMIVKAVNLLGVIAVGADLGKSTVSTPGESNG